MCEQARAEAFAIMVAHAEQMGANAIIGVRYDATEIAQNMTEVLAYGSAVVVEGDAPHRLTRAMFAALAASTPWTIAHRLALRLDRR